MSTPFGLVSLISNINDILEGRRAVQIDTSYRDTKTIKVVDVPL